jgi:hypothetical protein
MAFPNFHDGSFDGLLINREGTIDVYLTTQAGERYTLACRGVESARIEGVRQGNIIFDVSFLGAEDLTPEDVGELCELSPVDKAVQEARILRSARERSLLAIVISPSYGAQCWILCAHWDLHSRRDHAEGDTD